jgi:hypothetical protein
VVTHQRLTRNHSHRALVLAEAYGPDQTAIAAGWLDAVVHSGEVVSAAQAKAAELMMLNMQAHTANKLKGRAETIAALRAAIDAEFPRVTPSAATSALLAIVFSSARVGVSQRIAQAGKIRAAVVINGLRWNRRPEA